jgi:hypothetical protein
MPLKLAVSNASPYQRRGYVATPWQPILQRAKREELDGVVLRDDAGTPLPAQVDRVDPSDPSLDTLVFSLAKPVRAGRENYSDVSTYVTLDKGEPAKYGEGQPGLQATGPNPREIVLTNSNLRVTFNLSSTPWLSHPSCYAGAATSVHFQQTGNPHDWTEMLDPFQQDWYAHDMEKRCMQIDELQVFRAPWGESPYEQVRLFDQPYELIARSSGPVRASITIASEEFDVSYFDGLTAKRRDLTCRLYRVISLYADAHYVLEELFVRGRTAERAKSLSLYFAARYFMYMWLGHDRRIYRFTQIPDWFALGSGPAWRPFPGYGFATDVHASPVSNPHPGFPHPDLEDRTFSWALKPSQLARCVHLFMRDQPEGFDARTGRCWYEVLYKPLQVLDVLGGLDA